MKFRQLYVQGQQSNSDKFIKQYNNNNLEKKFVNCTEDITFGWGDLIFYLKLNHILHFIGCTFYKTCFPKTCYPRTCYPKMKKVCNIFLIIEGGESIITFCYGVTVVKDIHSYHKCCFQ